MDVSLIVLVLGNADAFNESLLELLSDQAGDSVQSPEDLMIQLEEALESGDITEDDLHELIRSRTKNNG